MLDADTLYQVPLSLQEQRFDDLVCEHLQLPNKEADMEKWKQLVNRVRNLSKTISIAVVGKYVELPDAYLSIVEALKHAGISYDTDIDLRWIDSEQLTENTLTTKLEDVDGIVVPGGFGTRGMDGKIITIRYAREKDIPFLGVGIGMQLAAVEFARNVLQLKEAHAIEVDPNTPYPMTRFANENGNNDELGGTLRLGIDAPIYLEKGTKIQDIYDGATEITERHRNRYELNPTYREQFEQKGLTFSAHSRDQQSIEVIEIKEHTWFVACQYHPQFKSRPTKAHPLIEAFVKAVVEEKYNKKEQNNQI